MLSFRRGMVVCCLTEVEDIQDLVPSQLLGILSGIKFSHFANYSVTCVYDHDTHDSPMTLCRSGELLVVRCKISNKKGFICYYHCFCMSLLCPSPHGVNTTALLQGGRSRRRSRTFLISP